MGGERERADTSQPTNCQQMRKREVAQPRHCAVQCCSCLSFVPLSFVFPSFFLHRGSGWYCCVLVPAFPSFPPFHSSSFLFVPISFLFSSGGLVGHCSVLFPSFLLSLSVHLSLFPRGGWSSSENLTLDKQENSRHARQAPDRWTSPRRLQGIENEVGRRPT